MARIDFMPPIAGIHGQLAGKSGYYFRELKKGSGVYVCCRIPRRTKPPTQKQLLARMLFASVWAKKGRKKRTPG